MNFYRHNFVPHNQVGMLICCISVEIKPMTESFAELFEESLASQSLKPGTIVTGMVVEIRDDSVVVYAGLKS